MRVLILWADQNSANLGVRVLADGAAEIARQAWGPEIKIDFQNFSPNDDGLPFAGRVVLRDLGRRNGPLKQKLRGYDVILDTGAGDSFADIYGLKRLAWMVNIHRLAHQLSIPVALTPQTVGPFDTWIGRLAARYVLSKAKVALVRDSVSFKYSVKYGRLPDAKTTDLVFLLPAPNAEQTRDVILNVSGLLWNENPHVNSTRYRQAVRELAQSLITDGRRLTLLAHVLENPSPDSDAAAVHELADELNNSVEAVIPQSLEEARAVIAGGQVLIGARMHACLNALSMGVATIPWAYSRKFKPLFDELGWDLTVDLRVDGDPVSETLRILRDPSFDRRRGEALLIAGHARGTFVPAVEALGGIMDSVSR